MLSSKLAKYGTRLALALIIGLAVVGSLSIPVQAQEPIDLVLGGEGATSWNIDKIKPGDSGTKTVELHNAGYRDGFVTIWISDIEQVDHGGDGALLDDCLLFNLSHERLSTNIAFPATIHELPQSAPDSNYIKINPLYAGETLTLVWEWEFPETGEPQNDAQGDSLSFTINYMLEELPADAGEGEDGEYHSGDDDGEYHSGDDDRDGGQDGGSPPEPQTLLLRVDMWGKVTSGQITEQGILMETIEAVSPNGALVLLLPQGTRVLGSAGNPLDLIEVRRVTPPQPPLSKLIIGPGYDLQPFCTFDPPIKLILHYQPQGLSDGIDDKDLVIAYWYQSSQEWAILPSLVDTVAETVTAQLSHSSMFAMLATAPPVTLIRPQEPTMPPVPETTPPAALGSGGWLGIGVGIALLFGLIVWLIIRRHKRQAAT